MNYRELYCKEMGWNYVPHGHEIHHKIPRKNGGSDDFENLVCICKCDHEYISSIQHSKNPSKYEIKRVNNILEIWEKKKIEHIKIEDRDDWKPSKNLQNFFNDIKYIEKWLINGGTGTQICKDTNNKYGSKSTLNKYIRRYLMDVPIGKERRILYNKKRSQSKETKLKISKALKGYKCSEEKKLKISIGNTGKIPWNKDKKLSEEHKLKISIGNKIPWNKGKKLSEEHKLKISKTSKGRIPWNKDKKISEEIRLKISKSCKIKRINCKLTKFEIEQIKKALIDGIKVKTLAEVFNVSTPTIYRIKRKI